MTTEQLLLFTFLAFLAEILGTVGGFGSSLFFVPIAGYFLGFQSVLGITALFHVSSNLVKIGLFRSGFDRKLIVSLGIPSVVFVIAGAWLSSFLDPKVLQVALGIFLLSISLVFLWFRSLKLKPTAFNAFAGGASSGLIAGLLGTGGAIRGLVLAAYDMRKEVFIATSAAIDLAIDSSRSVVYTMNGYVHKRDLFLIPILFCVSVAGTFAGKNILAYVSEKQFRTVVLLLVLATGLFSLVKIYS